ncbi:MAG TPA: RHS repeat-associated core domain-containing protein, partial [Verrucomicrobiae bacterium]|nr:RHS repeat-associated core domain-containing protein [Verrucomicrobiae bacterium]
YEFIYDPAGRLIRVRDAYGKVTEITRDGSGKPTTIVSPYGQSTALELNPNGILATVTSPAGDITRMSYVSTGLLSSVTGPRGYAYTFTYDDRGQLASASDPGGGLNLVPRTTGTNGHEVTETTVEGRVRHFSLTESDEGTETTEDQYADGTMRRRIAQPNGTTTNRLPDGTIIHSTQAAEPRFQMQSPFFREMVVSTPGGVTSTTTVERGVNLLFRKDPLSLTRWSQATTQNGKTSRVIFESSSRVFTRLSPMGRLRTTKVNTAGDPEEVHRGDLAPTTYEYNAGGQLTSAAQGSRLTKMSYNAQGYLSAMTNAINQVWRYAYDAAGRATNTIRPDGQSTATSYDGEGNLISLTPPGKPAHGFSHTPVGLLSEYIPPPVGGATNAVRWTWNRDRKIDSCTRADGGVIDYVYNSAFQVEGLLCPGFTNQYVYDPAYGYLASVARGGQTVSFVRDGPLPVSETWSGPVAGSVSRGWNADFRVASITVGGTIINGAYDDDGLLTQAGDMYLDYDTNGLHVGTTLGNLSETWRYNPFGEVTNYTATCSGSLVLSLTYTRDPLGRITALTSQTAGSTQSVVYAYDAAGRLNHVTRGTPPTYDYFYDANGNRTNLFAPAQPPTPATYDAQDRILTCGTNSYTWSDDGEIIAKTSGPATTLYRHDALGNLTGATLPSGTVIEYVLDGLGRRVGKNINGALSRGYLYSGTLAPIAELDGSNNIVSVFVYGRLPNVPDYMVRGGTIYRLVSDHLGSVRLVVNAQTGTVAQEITYDEFGRVLSDSNPGFQPFGFAGGLYDPDTGLVHFGEREYDPETGRWMSRDPLLFAGGDMNLYAYCGNDPVNQIDPSGLGPGTQDPVAMSEAESVKPVTPGEPSTPDPKYRPPEKPPQPPPKKIDPPPRSPWGQDGYDPSDERQHDRPNRPDTHKPEPLPWWKKFLDAVLGGVLLYMTYQRLEHQYGR